MVEYGTLTVATGSAAVPIDMLPFTGRVNGAVTLWLPESVTVTWKLAEGAPAGAVPLRYPAVVRVSQEGRPAAIQVYPGLPPDALKFAV